MKCLIPEEKHERVMKHGHDVPAECPSFTIPLDRVGISGKTVWVNLPQGVMPFEASISVDLVGERRGIHMSRMEEAIAALARHSFEDLASYAVDLCRQVIVNQQATWAVIDLSGRLPHVSRTPVSNRSSLDTILVNAACEMRKTDVIIQQKVKIGLAVHHITACPCTQAYNAELLNAADDSFPLPTHSQRSITRLTVGDCYGTVSFPELLAVLTRALHVNQDLLKRPDEAEVVLKSHSFPQFAEDAVRDTARAAGELLGPVLPDEAEVLIESTSLESIHIHDVQCLLKTSIGELKELLRKV